MNKAKRILCFLLVLTMMLSVFAGCTKKDGDVADTTGTTAPAGDGTTQTYTVKVKTAGGMAMAELDVSVYSDAALGNMVGFAKTDANGTATFSLEGGIEYYIVLTGVPKGYDLKEYYSFSGTNANITLTSALITDEDLNDVTDTLGLGDVMYDFTYTTPDGTSAKLSDMLAEKDAVLINFWFAACSPCASEFPYMETAYQTYKEDMGVIALSYIDESAAVGAYQTSMGLSFPMASCNSGWPGIFGFNNFPSTIVVDRYGVIALIEVGALTSLRPFNAIMEHFTGDDYEQKLCNGVADVVTVVTPTEVMPTTEEIAEAINVGDIQVTYRAEEGEAADTTWPFVITEKNGQSCIKASNSLIEASYAIIYADVTMKAGQAVCFDYLASCEQGSDVMVVIVEGNDIYQISGYSETEEWKKCYPWVAEEDGTYEIALCYMKDESTDAGDDTVYVDNLRIVDVKDIDEATYLPRQAAVTKDGFAYTYVDVVLNEKDGYYHVGTKNGPLLLANLMGYSQFNSEQSIYEIAYDGQIVKDGKDYYDDILKYFTYCSNSAMNGYTSVTEELGTLLKIVSEVVGVEGTEDEWLKICEYYQPYGTTEQLVDPIAGLAPFSAYTAKLGKNIDTNYFYYNRVILPRGLFAKFVPTKSGAYRITSRNESQDGVEGWISDGTEMIYTYEGGERMFDQDGEISMVYYMEKGKAYYIDIAFWDMYEEGYVYYDIEYLGTSYNLFKACSPGFFTYDTDATGEAMYHTIAGGIEVALGIDGYYYEVRGTRENGTKILGSKIYADFSGLTSIFNTPIATGYAYNEDGTVMRDENGNKVEVKGLIESGAFDFSKDENDMFVLQALSRHNGDVDATDKYLREYWGEDYDANAAEYKLTDVFAGRYHGTGEDLTKDAQAYVSKMIGGSSEKAGCVQVDARLAELLQMLMDKYTFANVDNSWIKLCYYYQYIGA